MRHLRKYGYEILASILGIAFATMLLYLLIVTPEDLTVRGTIMFAMLFDAIAIYFVLRKLWRTKWRYRIMPSVQKVLEKLVRVIRIFQKKLGLVREDSKTVLRGRATVIFDFKSNRAQQKRSKKPQGWKNLQSDKERLGYLYRHMIDSNIHQGLPVFSSETPTEIKEKKDYAEYENQIFDLYVANRYKNDVNLDRTELDDLRKELKNSRG